MYKEKKKLLLVKQKVRSNLNQEQKIIVKIGEMKIIALKFHCSFQNLQGTVFLISIEDKDEPYLAQPEIELVQNPIEW